MLNRTHFDKDEDNLKPQSILTPVTTLPGIDA